MAAKMRMLPVLAAVLMAFALMPMVAQTAHAAEAGYANADGFECWIVPDEGTAVIWGRAEGNEAAELAIPAAIEYDSETYTVTKIVDYAFQDDRSVTKLTVAEGITEIGGSAFEGCSNLSDIHLPDTLDAIGINAFRDTDYYNGNSKWDNNVLYIGSYLIKAKSEFEGNYTVKEGTRLIAEEAFKECYGLTGVSIPASVVKIGSSAFQSCSSLTSVAFAKGSSLTEIRKGAFFNCNNLTSIDIPASVRLIEQMAFAKTGLTRIALPEGLQNIDFQLFKECSSLVEVTIPSTVTEIWDFAFYNCNSLTTIRFGGSPSQWAAITGGGKPADELVKEFGKEDEQTITASDVTKTFGNAAFNLDAETSGDGALTYESGNTKVATVSSAGKVTIKGAGSAKITISAAATENYAAASKTITVTVKKAANPLSVGPKTATVKYSKLQKKAQKLAVAKVINFKKKTGDKKTYTLSSAKKGKKSFKKYFAVNKSTGKVAVKKGLKKGTYKVTVKVKANGDANYNASKVKTVTFTVRVK